MNEVTRYDLTEDVSTGELDITPVPERMEGRYVTFEDYEALAQQLTATTNSLTNAQEALKSAGTEADTVQAGVMELVNKLAEMQKQPPIYQYMTVSMSDETWLQERWHDCTKEEFDNANDELGPTRRVYAQQQPVLAEGLHPETAELVMHFAEALARKLRKSEQKYGWSDGWKDSDWQEKCLADFHHHIGKGDPLDVAAYCAFMVYHGWSTCPAPAIDLNAVRAEGVEMLAESIENGRRLHILTFDYFKQFAAQLRAGNAGKDGV